MSRWSIARRAYAEALPAIAGSAVAGLLAGVLLGGLRDAFVAVPGLLVLVPAMLATRGNVYGSLGARLSTGLQIGTVEPTILGERRLAGAIAAALISGLTMNAFAALATVAILGAVGPTVPPAGTLLAIAVLAGLLAGIVLSTLVVAVVVLGFRRGQNPDTLVGPVVTTAGDVFGVALLALAVRVVIG